MSAGDSGEAELLFEVERMCELLSISGQSGWRAALEVAINDSANRGGLGRSIMSLYGGAGSINDVVLYLGGEVMVEKSNEFDQLRIRVFDLCKRLVH